MPDCPKCQTALVRRRNDFGVFWHCGRCTGSAVTISLLRKMVAKDAMNGLWQRVRLGSYPRKHPCPGCRRRMEEVSVEAEGRTRAIDVCGTCQFIWLDEGEWTDLAYFAVEKPAPVNVADQVRAQIAAMREERDAPPAEPMRVIESVKPEPEDVVIPEAKPVRPEPQAKVERAPRAERREVPRERARPRAEPNKRRPVERRSPERRPVRREAESGWGTGPTHFWHWIPAFLGLPVEDEQPLGRRQENAKPWFTWTLAIGVTLVSLLAMFDLRAVVEAYGLIPAEFDRLNGLTWLTSFFLHGGLLHLLGNMYFLVVFGDNVEKCLGTLEFFMLLVLATLCGDFVHILLDPDSTVPCIGASGGISGVIAFYALRFPKQRLAVMFWFLVKTFWWRMGAFWMFAIWVILQGIIAGQQIAGMSQVSGGAHLGGALVGVVAWALWRVNGGERDATSRLGGRRRGYA